MVAESPTELRIEFSSRPGLGVWPHGVGLAPIMPAHVWAGQTDGIDKAADLYALDPDADVSGGPLQIVSITDSRIETVANPGYPDQGIPDVVYSVFADEAAAIAAIKADAIDTVLDPNGLSDEGVSALAGTPGVAIERSPANSVRYLGFNLTRDPDVETTVSPESRPAARSRVGYRDSRAGCDGGVHDAVFRKRVVVRRGRSGDDRGSLRAGPRIPGERCHFRTGGRGLRMGDRACSGGRHFGTRPRSDHRRPAPCSPHHPDPGRRVRPGAS